MIPAFLLALNLATSDTACHTTAIVELHHKYTDQQINTIVSRIFPPWTFVVCGIKITDNRQSVEVRYGPQRHHVTQT